MGKSGLVVQYNKIGTIVAAGAAVLTVTFLDKDGKPSKAKRINLRFDAPPAHVGKIHWKQDTLNSGGADPDATNSYFFPGDTDLIGGGDGDEFIARMRFINLDAAENATVAIKAVSDRDISGTTIT